MNKRGISLIELCIILAVISILGVMVAPQISTFLDQGNRNICSSQSASIEKDYRYEKNMNPTWTLQNAIDSSNLTCPSGGVYSVENNEIVCSIHGNFNADTPAILWPNRIDLADPMGQILAQDKIQDYLDKYGGATLGGSTTIDSSAPSPNNFADAIKAAFEAETGVNLDDVIGSWCVQFTNVGVYYLYWTTVDVNDYAPGEKIPVMRYNSERGTYTAGEITVEQKGSGSNTYMALTRPGFKEFTGQNDTSKKDVNATYDVFEANVDRYAKP